MFGSSTMAKRLSFAISLALFASTATADLRLSELQVIGADNVGLRCLLAYDATLGRCDIGDIERGCSRRCQEEMEAIEANIQTACENTLAVPGTLLELAQQGQLTQVMCAGIENRPPPSTTSAPESTITPAPTASIPVGFPFLTRSEGTTITTSIVPKPASTGTRNSPVQDVPGSEQGGTDGGRPYDVGGAESAAGSLRPGMTSSMLCSLVAGSALLGALLY
jgi:hypothetical protein